jgi:hypothetical protein
MYTCNNCYVLYVLVDCRSAWLNWESHFPAFNTISVLLTTLLLILLRFRQYILILFVKNTQLSLVVILFLHFLFFGGRGWVSLRSSSSILNFDLCENHAIRNMLELIYMSHIILSTAFKYLLILPLSGFQCWRNISVLNLSESVRKELKVFHL